MRQKDFPERWIPSANLFALCIHYVRYSALLIGKGRLTAENQPQKATSAEKGGESYPATYALE